jgi:hypothetical protein
MIERATLQKLLLLVTTAMLPLAVAQPLEWEKVVALLVIIFNSFIALGIVVLFRLVHSTRDKVQQSTPVQISARLSRLEIEVRSLSTVYAKLEQTALGNVHAMNEEIAQLGNQVGLMSARLVVAVPYLAEQREAERVRRERLTAEKLDRDREEHPEGG